MILDAFRLDGKVALVTGARTGLGRSMALALAEAGADIAAVGRSEMAEVGEAVASVGRKFLPIHADLSKGNPAAEIVAEVVREFGKLDILVNNAGTTRRAKAVDFEEDDWDFVLNVNLRSVFFLCQAAARQFLQQGTGGKIVNIASLLSYQGGILTSPYTASKYGVRGITQTLSNELADKGININAIAPGYMLTDLTRPLHDDPERNPQILDRIPAGRWGKPDDLKGIVVFLASAASDYMNGVTVPVDGGWLGR